MPRLPPRLLHCRNQPPLRLAPRRLKTNRRQRCLEAEENPRDDDAGNMPYYTAHAQELQIDAADREAGHHAAQHSNTVKNRQRDVGYKFCTAMQQRPDILASWESPDHDYCVAEPAEHLTLRGHEPAQRSEADVVERFVVLSSKSMNLQSADYCE
ncbi:hypothetical protein AK812_SmicGene45695 [Symbiodinium microadriaticum]|uniref:Uncharacterized protein n=1 Tax=Symbiodinium microadriaticum TaxID=2951 RepID=A0A1Q9BVH5_SYMMI|nr:hypothetical protein AK812_SmicGene45719 [Symbiodinium microadriaticum]OLP74698.1 hypothetical protein AK812_SmicGene45695 [Symbiodinium microadriaticum]